MKRYIKILTTLLATFLLSIACIGTSACAKENVKTAKVSIQLYNYTENKFYADDDVTMSIDLFGHLAPKTVEAISKYISDGYYNNAIFYQMEVDGTKQIMVGNLLVDGNTIVEDAEGNVNIKLNATKIELPGEFTNGGTVGSDLLNTKGSVGLWRDWYKNGDYTNSAGMNTGRATWFMLDAPKTKYDGCFCVFGQFSLDDTANVTAYDGLKSAFNTSGNYEEYKAFWVGDFDATKENYGLTFRCTTKTLYNKLVALTDEEIEALPEDEKAMSKVFDSKDEEYEDLNTLYSYDDYTIRVAKNKDGKLGAVIKTATVADKK